MIVFCLIILALGSEKVYAKKPKLLICGYAGKHLSERKMFEKYGFKVEVFSPIRVDPDDWDGLVIPGSKKNVNPRFYGAKRDRHTNKGDIHLDRCQLRITRQFMKAKKPILGICRGCQLINVAAGGTLIQHIGVKRGGCKSGRWKGFHHGTWKVRIKKGSWLYDVFGKTESVRHSHHQCVDKLGKGLVATQWDTKSGLIEGYEHDTLPIYALQWHPDLMRGNVPKQVCMKFKRVVLAGKKVK
jgi:putative glutamine amidotransferase